MGLGAFTGVGVGVGVGAFVVDVVLEVEVEVELEVDVELDVEVELELDVEVVGTVVEVELVVDVELDPLYEATLDIVEEAILNSIFAGVEMRGHGHHVAPALPISLTHEAVLKYRPEAAPVPARRHAPDGRRAHHLGNLTRP